MSASCWPAEMLMENDMRSNDHPTIRRRTNGTIDCDYYREAAILMRREASVDIMRGAGVALWASAAAVVLLLCFATVETHSAPTQLSAHSAR